MAGRLSRAQRLYNGVHTTDTTSIGQSTPSVPLISPIAPRRGGRADELVFLLINDTRLLVPYRQSVLVLR